MVWFGFSLLLLLLSVYSICQYVFIVVGRVVLKSPTATVAGSVSASISIYVWFMNLDLSVSVPKHIGLLYHNDGLFSLLLCRVLLYLF